MRRRLGYLIAASALVLQACAANSEKRAEIIGPVWVAETITGMPVIAGSQVTLKFDADGKAGGNAGCNTYGSGYQRDGTKIEFEQPFSTKMFCSPDAVMTQEQAYFDMLNRTTTYETPTDKLILQAPNGQTVVFHRQQ